MRPAWFAAELRTATVVIRVPGRDSFVASPMRVAGVGSGFEATLNTIVRDDDGRVLHPRPGADEGYVMGGAMEPEPFEGRLLFLRPTTPAGTLTVSADPGNEVAIVRIRF